jgi:predicted O-methyltransferase YrrM
MTKHKTISYIIPSLGRPSLKKTLASIETWPGDQILVIQHNPPSWDWGSSERNEAISKATCDYLSFMDDDDSYVPGARKIMDTAIRENPQKLPILFKMKYPSGKVLWDKPVLKCGNVGSPMIFIPNIKEKLCLWNGERSADFQFINGWGWSHRKIIWRPEIIALIGHEDDGGTLSFITQKYNLDLNQPLPIQIPNMGRDNLAQLFAELKFKSGVEIGTEAGLYAEVLCKSNPKAKLYCIDPWKAYSGYREHVTQSKLDDIYISAKTRLAPFNCELIRTTSMEALSDFADQSLDYVYIDGNHEYNYISQDIKHWINKIKSGGIISGHDYLHAGRSGYKCDVVYAVNEYTQTNQINPWFLIGTKAMVPGEIRDKSRSWMWVKI